MTKTDLSIIIISFNTRQILVDCIESVIKNTKSAKYEIIVVENGSTDGTLEAIKLLSKKYSEVVLVNTGENLGFGRGNNLGAKNAKGQYLLFLNSDTLVNDNVITSSLKKAKSLKKLGAYSCQLLNADGTFQPSGGHFPTLGNLLAWQFFIEDLPGFSNSFKSIHPHEPGFFFLDRLINRKKISHPHPNKQSNPDWVTGAFVIIPKKVFDKVGGFDENIFMYTEEMELCYRLSHLGLKTYYDPDYSIVHLGGASGGSFLAITSEVRYMIYFWQKHKPKWQLPIVRFAFFVGSLLRLIIFGIIKGDEKYLRAYSYALKLCL